MTTSATTTHQAQLPEPPVALHSITGSRYSVEELGEAIATKLTVTPQGMVSASDAAQIQRLLDGQKTEILMLNDASVAKLYVSTVPGEKPTVQQIDVQAKLTIRDQFLGHTFSELDKANLSKYGNMGRKVELTDKFTQQKFEAYIGVDTGTNRTAVVKADRVNFPKTMLGVTLTDSQQQALKDGKSVRIDGMQSKEKGVFNAYVRYHAGGTKLKFVTIPLAKGASVGAEGVPLKASPQPEQPVNVSGGGTKKLPAVTSSKAAVPPRRQKGDTANEKGAVTTQSPGVAASKKTRSVKR